MTLTKQNTKSIFKCITNTMSIKAKTYAFFMFFFFQKLYQSCLYKQCSFKKHLNISRELYKFSFRRYSACGIKSLHNVNKKIEKLSPRESTYCSWQNNYIFVLFEVTHNNDNQFDDSSKIFSGIFSSRSSLKPGEVDHRF